MTRTDRYYREAVRSRKHAHRPRRVLTALGWVAGAAAFVVFGWLALVWAWTL